MTPKRRSLADRDHDAITTNTAEPPTDAPASTPPTTRRPQRVNQASDTVRISVTMTAESYNQSKAAYLADWQHDHRHDTFAAWIIETLERHARRTPEQRAETVETPTGQPRSFSIPPDLVQRINQAIRDDQQAGHWPTRSAWCNQALTAAINHTLARDGALPTSPARLPQRLL